MDSKLKKAYTEEVQFQLKMLQNLKGWLKNAMLCSSIFLVLLLFGSQLHSMLTFIGIGGMTISIIATLLLGLAIKKGSRNLQLLLGEKA